jgi:excisionase family DNA binding protein
MAVKPASVSKFYSVDDVADALGVHPKTVRRRITAGELRVHRIGRQIRISAEDFRAYVALRRV